jgi:hypothetical protein
MIDQDERMRLVVVGPHHQALEQIRLSGNHGANLQGLLPNAVGLRRSNRTCRNDDRSDQPK